jgi:hypothetical protein
MSKKGVIFKLTDLRTWNLTFYTCKQKYEYNVLKFKNKCYAKFWSRLLSASKNRRS